MTLSGSVKRLHSFSATVNGVNADGAQPTSGLTLGADGDLYGVTPSGGKYGNGLIYRITTSGSFTPLYSFASTDADGVNTYGATPMGELARAAGGVFYGVANGGGPDGFGVVYKITTTGAFTFTRYYYFTGGADGAYPLDVTLGPSGSLWGTTSGGQDAGGSFFGLFTNETATDYSFTGGADGEIPDSGLLPGSDGNLYGTTNSGGSNRQGTFFEIVLNNTVIPPWGAATGRYYGLLGSRLGDLNVSLASSGKITATLLAGKSTHTYSGTLSAAGGFTETVSGVKLSLQLQMTDARLIFTGMADNEAVTAFRSAYDAGEPLGEVGSYTAGIFPKANTGATFVPAGYGDSLMTVSAAGLVTLTGSLADGSALHSEGLLLQGLNGYDQYLFFNDSDLTGSIAFQPGSGFDCSGVIDWADAAGQNSYFPKGFSSTLTIEGTRYAAPAAGVRALPFTSGIFILSGGGLATAIQEKVNLSTANGVSVVGANPKDLKITIDAATGTFTGTFLGPSSPKTTTFSGVLYQNATRPGAYGRFLGPVSEGVNGSGAIELAP